MNHGGDGGGGHSGGHSGGGHSHGDAHHSHRAGDDSSSPVDYGGIYGGGTRAKWALVRFLITAAILGYVIFQTFKMRNP